MPVQSVNVWAAEAMPELPGCTVEGKDVSLEQAYQKILESVRVELCQ